MFSGDVLAQSTKQEAKDKALVHDLEAMTATLEECRADLKSWEQKEKDNAFWYWHFPTKQLFRLSGEAVFCSTKKEDEAKYLKQAVGFQNALIARAGGILSSHGLSEEFDLSED